MHRKQHADADCGNDQHRVIQRVIRAAGGPEQRREADADDRRGHRVDLHDLDQADLEQPQHKLRLLVEGVGQKAVVAVHKERLREARAAVDRVKDKDEIRQPREHHTVDLGLDLRHEVQHEQQAAGERAADKRDAFRRFPQDLLVPLDEKLVEVLKALFPARDRCIG